MRSVPRMTRQRQVILAELRMTHDHPTADELYAKVRMRLPKISLGTVYRNLDMLASSGMIRKLANTGSQMRFDGDLQGHTHIRCISCGKIADIDAEPEPTDCDHEIVAGSGFKFVERKVEYVGICPDCDTKRGKM